MKTEIRFIYPSVSWEQDEFPLMSRLPAEQIRKQASRGGKYIPPEAMGHIQTRKQEYVTEMVDGKAQTRTVWTAWECMCMEVVTESVNALTRPNAVHGRAVCSACVRAYKADDALPDNRAFTNWAEGGFKLFEGS